MWWGQATDREEWRKVLLETETSSVVELMMVMFVEYVARNEENLKVTQSR
jgi:hypothetical protein